VNAAYQRLGAVQWCIRLAMLARDNVRQRGEIEAVIAFVASEEAFYLTGANVVMDGGQTTFTTAFGS
jgi:hypothetical protein